MTKHKFLFILLIVFFSLSCILLVGIFNYNGRFIRYNEIGDMDHKRINIVPLEDNKLFVLKRIKIGLYNPFYIYDMKKNIKTYSGLLNSPVYPMLPEPTTLLLDSGEVLILVSSFSHWGEIYNPKTGTLSFIGENLEPLDNFAATKLQDGRVLIVNSKNKNYSKTMIFDPQNKKITHINDILKGKILPKVTLLADGRVLLSATKDNFSEDSLLIFDLKHNKLEKIDNLSEKDIGYHKEFFALSDGKILINTYLTSSCKQYDKDSNQINFVIYDPKTKQVNVSQADFLYGVTEFKITPLNNDKFLITGGRRTENIECCIVSLGKTGVLDPETRYSDKLIFGYPAEAWIYDAKKNKYTKIKNKMNIPRSNHDAIKLNDGKVLITGGFNDINNKTITPVKGAELFIP